MDGRRSFRLLVRTGQFTQSVFSYSAYVGLRYAVERSATWSNWTTIRTDTANVNPMTFTDTAATNRINFYRVRRLPNP